VFAETAGCVMYVYGILCDAESGSRLYGTMYLNRQQARNNLLRLQKTGIVRLGEAFVVRYRVASVNQRDIKHLCQVPKSLLGRKKK